MKYIITFKQNKNFETNHYADFKIDDDNNVHQNSVKKKISKNIQKLEQKYDRTINYQQEMNNCDKLSERSKILINLIFLMNIYSKTYKRYECYLLSLIWNIVKVDDKKILNLDKNLLDCYIDNKIVCIDGRIARIFEAIGLHFVSLWEYKEQITDILVFFVNSLIIKNKRYNILLNKQQLNEEETLELWLINHKLIKYLNKIFTKKYIETNILDYNVLKTILLINYKELFIM